MLSSCVVRLWLAPVKQETLESTTSLKEKQRVKKGNDMQPGRPTTWEKAHCTVRKEQFGT